MTNEELIHRILDAQHEQITALNDLTIKSEARIDRTNEIVCKLAQISEHNQQIVTTLTQEYSKHLADLSECRNELLRQNEMLLKMHEQDLVDKREMREQINDNARRIFGLLSKMSGGTKVENNFGDK